MAKCIELELRDSISDEALYKVALKILRRSLEYGAYGEFPLHSMAEILQHPVVRAAIDPRGWRGLLGGGLAYTLGVPWFLRGADYGGVDHVIWHLFVLAGSALHYNAILRYLVWAPPVVP